MRMADEAESGHWMEANMEDKAQKEQTKTEAGAGRVEWTEPPL